MEIVEILKFAEMLSLTQLNCLILPNWVVLLQVFIEFRKFLYFCNFHTSLIGSFSVS